MIALKKIILFVLSAVLLCFAGCDKNSGEPDPGYNEFSGEPTVTLTINDSKKNEEKDIQIFDILSERERFAYLHYYIESETPKCDLRIRTEICRGEDDHNVGRFFKTLSDEMVTGKSGKWHHKDMFVATADIYFYRVTIYNGDSEKILASKTIYTPKEEQVYSEVLQDVPEYRPIGLTEEEQIFYDLCSYTVFDHAEKHEYSKINNIEGFFSADGTKLYLEVIFRPPWSEYFEINVNEPTDYSVSYEPFDVEGPEKALPDYYYVIEEFKTNLQIQ